MAASVGIHPMDPLAVPVSVQDFLRLPELDLSDLRIAVSDDFGCCALAPAVRRQF